MTRMVISLVNMVGDHTEKLLKTLFKKCFTPSSFGQCQNVLILSKGHERRPVWAYWALLVLRPQSAACSCPHLPMLRARVAKPLWWSQWASWWLAGALYFMIHHCHSHHSHSKSLPMQITQRTQHKRNKQCRRSLNKNVMLKGSKYMKALIPFGRWQCTSDNIHLRKGRHPVKGTGHQHSDLKIASVTDLMLCRIGKIGRIFGHIFICLCFRHW